MKNQHALLRDAFDRGERLTVLDAVMRYGIYALSQRCGELRVDGYPVESEMITTATGKRIARYRKVARVAQVLQV